VDDPHLRVPREQGVVQEAVESGDRFFDGHAVQVQ
jgi:hypothetical protein